MKSTCLIRNWNKAKGTYMHKPPIPTSESSLKFTSECRDVGPLRVSIGQYIQFLPLRARSKKNRAALLAMEKVVVF